MVKRENNLVFNHHDVIYLLFCIPFIGYVYHFVENAKLHVICKKMHFEILCFKCPSHASDVADRY